MMPQVLNVRVQRPGRRRLRLWIPLLPLALLLSPVLLLAALVAGVACVFGQRWAAKVLSATVRLLWAAPGTEIEFQQGPTAVLMTIR
jgi:hypothetical protein